MSQVVDRTGWTGKMENIVDWSINLDRLADVVFDEPERRLSISCAEVAAVAGQQVVHADDFVAVTHESLTKVRPDETCSTSNDCSQGESFCHGRSETDVNSSRRKLTYDLVPPVDN